MMMSRELAALDTNVLVYALYADAEHHRASRLLVDQGRNQDAALCITPQVLTEFYSVVTNSRRVTEAKSPEAVLDVIANLIAMPGLTLLPFPPDLVSSAISSFLLGSPLKIPAWTVFGFSAANFAKGLP